jgi:hypothetical protein
VVGRATAPDGPPALPGGGGTRGSTQKPARCVQRALEPGAGAVQLGMMGPILPVAVLLAATCAAAPAPGLQHDGSRPEGAPDDLDCELKRLAVSFAQRLLPDRGDLQTLHDALQLQSLCGDERPADGPNRVELVQRARDAGRLSSHSAGVVIVDPRANAGVSQNTVPTVAAALVLTRILGPGQRRVIQLRDGVHYLNETVILGPNDSGTEITSHNGEHATLSGGMLLYAAWDGISDAERAG